MKYIISNHSNIDACLILGNQSYLIKSNDFDFCLECDAENIICIKKAIKSPLPNKKKKARIESLGIFSDNDRYILDISSCYKVSYKDDDLICINIDRKTDDSNINVIYDSLCITSPNLQIDELKYQIDNKNEVTQMQRECQKKAHKFFYIFAEIVFFLAGIALSYPLLIPIYVVSRAWYIMLLIIFVPALLIVVTTLFIVLPMHFIFKWHDKEFFDLLDYEKIISHLDK